VGGLEGLPWGHGAAALSVNVYEEILTRSHFFRDRLKVCWFHEHQR
jgi:hypothetical protein